MDYIIEFTNLEAQVINADVVITGEGKIDEQTLAGKVVKGVADLAAKHRKNVIAVAGKLTLNDEGVRSLAIHRLITLSGKNTSEKEAMENAYSLVSDRLSAFWQSHGSS